MAGVNPTSDQASDLLQNLSLDGQSNPLEIPEATNNVPANQPLSADPGNASNAQMQATQMDPNMCYMPNAYQSGYYYPGYDNNSAQWEEYPPYADAVDMNQGVYSDNSVLYHGYGYASYAPYSPAGSPVPTMGNDGQLYGPQQHYQYPSPFFQTTTPTSGPYTPNTAVAPHSDIPASVGVEQKPLAVETVAANLDGGVTSGGNVKGNNGPAAAKPSYQNTSFGSSGSYGRVAFSGGIPTSGYQDPRFAFDALQSPPISWLDGSVFQDGQSRPFSNAVTSSASKSNNGSSRNYNGRPNSHYMGLQHPRPLSGAYVNRMYPGNKLYNQYGSSYNSGMGFGSSAYGLRTNNNRGWMAAENKNRPRGRNSGYYGYGSENLDGLNEMNRGPRGKSAKNQKGLTPVSLAVNAESVPLNNDEKEKNVSLDREQYNRPDFPGEYSDAKFLVIKSYSEDDVHKCIKYNVWASTPNGNKKLDAVYKEAQEKAGGCPVFLFFSVNGSGQFVGIAEMVGPVDFNKSCEYWQQDKWTGSFPVKWHIVKDVPNSSLKHITLENNENKPVTNSRDTQEVKLEQGLKVVKIFKEYSSQTCILDDFEFYENRQKTIQEKKARQQQFQKQVWEGKSAVEKKESVNDEQKSQRSTEGVSDLSKDGIPPTQTSGDLDESVVKTADAPKGVAPVSLSEKKIENGVANGH